jgi:hypothetical protein
MGAKHIVFTKPGYGRIILRQGSKSRPDKVMAKNFMDAGVSRKEVERLLGRKEKGRHST